MKLKENYNLNTTDGKVAFLNEAVKIVATIESPIERDVLHRNFAPNLRLIKMLFSSRFQRSKGGTDGRILKRKPVRYRRNLTVRATR